MSLPALVLAAGLGTRLDPLTRLVAKPAVPLAGMTLVERILSRLRRRGVERVVINLHHRPESIARFVGDGSDLGVRVRYSWEQPVLGSAGGPRHALGLVAEHAEDDFLIVNGDTLTDVDIRSLIARHRESGALVTMALIPNPRPSHYGGVAVSADGFVTGFAKVQNASAGAGSAPFHFIGVQVARARAFAELEDGVPAESVNALYPALIARDPRSIRAFVCSASFRDIGTPRDYLDTSLAVAAVEGDRLAAGKRVSIAPDATVIRTAIWDDVTIGAGARLTGCVLGDGVVIEPGAVHDRSAIVRAGARAPAEDERLEGALLIRPLD